MPAGVEYDESLSKPHMISTKSQSVAYESGTRCWRRGRWQGTLDSHKDAGDCLIRELDRDPLAPPSPPRLPNFAHAKDFSLHLPFKDSAHPTALRPAARTRTLPHRRIQLSFITMADNDAQVRFRGY
jgi:hypothetical protein